MATAILNDMLAPALVSTEALNNFRDEFRAAFQDYLAEGDRMAALLRRTGEGMTTERSQALRKQQGQLNAALRRYETARQSYVEAVMGQLAGLNAMGVKVN
ncbi:MAG TPA: hypothetical protein VEQ63_15690 [Bryobacteraceae bacterium]|nr:hypothetical protein [Bryobacteraceae bacterium]